MTKYDDNIIEMEIKRTKEEVLKRRFGRIKDIAVTTAKTQLQDARTYQIAAGVGLYQGLKYKGSLGLGFKASVATMAVMTGVNVFTNVAKNFDKIWND